MNNYFNPLFPFDISFDAEFSGISGTENHSFIPFSDEFFRDACRFAQFMAEREKELSDWFASLYVELAEKWTEKSDLVMKAYMIGGTILAALSLIATLSSAPLDLVTQSLLAGAVSGIGWNLADSVGGILAIPKLFQAAKESVLHPHIKTALAWTNAIYFSTVLPALSLWGFATLIQSVKAVGIKAVVASAVTLGASAALAGSAFAFAGGMFIVAGIYGFDWYTAAQKSEPVVLLRDRLKQCEVLQNKINECTDAQERQKLIEKLARMTEQAEALAYYCNKHNDTLKVQLTDDDENHPIFKEAVDSKKLTPIEQPLHREKQEKLAGYLIQKQQDKAKEKRFETIANTIGGVGALLGGLAFVIPPLAIPLLVGSVICLAISSAMKGYQICQKYQLAKEKEKALTENKNDAALVRDYFKGTEVAGLSEHDTKRIAIMQCKARLFAHNNPKTTITGSVQNALFVEAPGIQ
ncbi:MAG: hypothetical protein A3F13_05595 [Gammaproteobacteria bacterium RIFCSPHIGHO2_12_FULL_40_19]|nr:MAG: hypothetical protein A3F13_05595 [Gammaproteobacteria bacterium RIFCSPHIGHO2_12_FULL_40_19]